MRFIVRILKGIGTFLDRRFPEKMTVEEVKAKHEDVRRKLTDELFKFSSRIALLEDQHNKMLAKIASLSLMSGVRSSMAERE